MGYRLRKSELRSSFPSLPSCPGRFNSPAGGNLGAGSLTHGHKIGSRFSLCTLWRRASISWLNSEFQPGLTIKDNGIPKFSNTPEWEHKLNLKLHVLS
jgi:hypothetical protein